MTGRGFQDRRLRPLGHLSGSPGYPWAGGGSRRHHSQCRRRSGRTRGSRIPSAILRSPRCGYTTRLEVRWIFRFFGGSRSPRGTPAGR